MSDKVELRSSIAMPSTVHTYSVITEYISKWFLSRWSQDYFKTVHIEGKHVFDDYRSFDFSKVIRNGKPALAILPKIELEFDRDRLDTNMFGLNHIVDTGILKRSIVADYDNYSFIGTALHQLDINYAFRVRVESRAQQIDLYHYMSMAFRVGHRYVEQIDMDFHIPYKMMLQLARDAGYEVVNDKIVDIVSFLNYANTKSKLPIMFKLRTINQKMEFFMRFRDLDIAIDIPDKISHDDGEQEGQLFNNFHVEMQVNIKAPSPKFYVYYSDTSSDIDTIEESVFPDPIYVSHGYETVLTKFPNENAKGWNRYLITEYYEEDLENPMVIEFEELMNAMRLKDIIEYHKSIAIDSSEYINFYIINAEQPELPYDIDWDNFTLTVTEKVYSTMSTFAVYVDTEYIHEMQDTINSIQKSRVRLDEENR